MARAHRAVARCSSRRSCTRFQERGEVEPTLDVVTTAYVMRDLLDRTMKARVLFGQPGYADAIATLVRRALSPAEAPQPARAPRRPPPGSSARGRAAT